ncbi:MAG: hypothetical protein ACPGUD_09820 [Parashewanella sp.]
MATPPQICLTQSTAHTGGCTFFQVPQSDPISFLCNIKGCSNTFSVVLTPQATPNDLNQHIKLNQQISKFLSDHPKTDTTFYKEKKGEESRAVAGYRVSIPLVSTTIRGLSMLDTTSLINKLCSLGLISEQDGISIISPDTANALLIAFLNKIEKEPTTIVDFLEAFDSSNNAELKQITEAMVTTMVDF